MKVKRWIKSPLSKLEWFKLFYISIYPVFLMLYDNICQNMTKFQYIAILLSSENKISTPQLLVHGVTKYPFLHQVSMWYSMCQHNQQSNGRVVQQTPNTSKHLGWEWQTSEYKLLWWWVLWNLVFCVCVSFTFIQMNVVFINILAPKDSQDVHTHTLIHFVPWVLDLRICYTRITLSIFKSIYF